MPGASKVVAWVQYDCVTVTVLASLAQGRELARSSSTNAVMCPYTMRAQRELCGAGVQQLRASAGIEDAVRWRGSWQILALPWCGAKRRRRLGKKASGGDAGQRRTGEWRLLVEAFFGEGKQGGSKESGKGVKVFEL